MCSSTFTEDLLWWSWWRWLIEVIIREAGGHYGSRFPAGACFVLIKIKKYEVNITTRKSNL